jgi:hypothetical protein
LPPHIIVYLPTHRQTLLIPPKEKVPKSFSTLSPASPDRHILFNTHPKSPFHNCNTDLDLNLEPPFSLHSIAPIMQIFQPRHLEPTKWYFPCRCNARAAVTDTKRLKDMSINLPDQWALKS